MGIKKLKDEESSTAQYLEYNRMQVLQEDISYNRDPKNMQVDMRSNIVFVAWFIIIASALIATGITLLNNIIQHATENNLW